MRHPDNYTEEYRYGVATSMVHCVMKNGRIRTEYTGTENLPKEGGYIMFPNHQGKFDALGIIYAHSKPCSILMEEERSHMLLTSEFVDVLDGIRLNRHDMKKQLSAIRQLSDRVKHGKKYIVFPEGGYNHNQNTLQEFMPGAFKAALWACCPIVPVVLIDSYKPFELGGLKKVTTQVHFLEPIYYDDYKNMNTKEISDMVKGLIKNKMEAL